MAGTTIKQAIREALEDLSKADFPKFCHQLLDRRGEPRVRRRAVEDKGVLEITDLLVSTFTEPGALQVTLDTLRQINCNEEAKSLDSKTKDCVDKGDSTFCKTSARQLETKPSQEALKHAASQHPLQAAQQGGPPVMVKMPEDPWDVWFALSGSIIQFGKYKGQTFKWLLENDLSYTAYLVDSHQKERRDTTLQSPLMANKDSLTRFVNANDEVSKGFVGFGRYQSEKLQDLYESKDKDKISYVNFLRTKKSTCNPGSKMEVAISYILQRDQEQAAAATNRTTTSSTTRAATERLTKRKRVQSTRGQPTSAARTIWRMPKRSRRT